MTNVNSSKDIVFDFAAKIELQPRSEKLNNGASPSEANHVGLQALDEKLVLLAVHIALLAPPPSTGPPSPEATTQMRHGLHF